MSLTAITGATYATYQVPPKVIGKTQPNDKTDLLYKVSLPDAPEGDTGFAMVYSKASLTAGASIPATAIFLQNQDGSLFSVDLKEGDKVNLVTEGKNLSLYVYSPSASGAADRYSFNAATGIATTDQDQPTSIDALGISSAEAKSLRDIDGDGALGAKLETSNDPTGGLYKVSVAGQNIFATGAGLDKAKTIDISKNAMLNSDGSFWVPDNENASLRAVSKVNADKTVTWEIYATDTSTNEVTRYSFDKDRKLKSGDDGTAVLTAQQLAAAEKLNKRDLDGNTFFGVNITGTVDAKTGLFQGSILGQSFFLAGTNLKAGTATAPTDTSGMLIDGNGEAWALDSSLNIGAAIKGTGDEANKLTLYAYEGNANTGTHNHVLQFNFTLSADTGNYVLDQDSESGIDVDGLTLSSAEKAAKRDLNNDGVYGVQINGAADNSGGLYRASALGNDYLLVGRSLTSSSSKPTDLSTALLNADGTAWSPDDISAISTDTLRIVTHYADDKSVSGYDVYAKEDGGAFAKYSFDANYQLSDAGRIELSADDLAAAEKSSGRDLNLDGAFGAVVNASIDTKGGLYKASFGSIDTIYLQESKIPAIGSKVATRAVSLENAMRTEDGEDYWNLDDPDNFTIKAAYSDNEGNYHLIAVSNTDPTSIQKYSFADKKLSATIDLSLGDLSTIEAAQKRDLNGDGVTGVKVTATADKVGGLHVGTASGRSYLLLGATPKSVTDLSSALVTQDGGIWGTKADGTFDESLYNASTDQLVMTGNADSGYTLYVNRAAGEGNTVRQYRFDTNKTLIEDDDTGKALSQIDLADAEKSATRDINGDKTFGAKLTATLDKLGGLYTAQVGSDYFTIVSDSTPDKKGIALSDKVLRSDDEVSAWQASGTLTGVLARKDDSDTVTGYWVYENQGEDGFKRHLFNAERIWQESETITAVQMAQDEKTAGRDLSADKTVGVKINPPIDRSGGLYSANILGQNYLLVGQNLKTGTNAQTAVDLSQALLDADGNAWSAAEGYSIAGGYLDADTKNYSVFTYQKDDNGIVTSVQRTVWNAKFEIQDTTEADPVELVSLEAAQKRDFSGDGTVGFRVLSTKSNEAYLGVTEARVSNDTSFWLVGDNTKQGTKTNPLSLKNALLNEDGSGPWYLDNSYFIKGVDDTGNDRLVYTTNAEGTQVLRFTFDKNNGRVKNGSEPVEVTGIELAKRELELKRDLNGDGLKGASYVEPLTGKGMFKVSMLGQSYLVAGSSPMAGKSIDLSKALLDTDGNAWAPTEGVTLRGTYTNSDGNTEIYGTQDEDGASVRYTFTQTEGASTLTLSQDSENLTGITLALREALASKDLNGDSSIGFKVKDAIANQANGWAVGNAGVGEATDDQIYIVGRNLAQMGTKASNVANNAALVESVSDGVPTYWKPDEGYTIKSIVQTSDSSGATTGVSIYAQQVEAGDDHADDYLKYDFTLQNGNWTLNKVENDKATKLDQRALVQAEASLKRDLNADSGVGFKLSTDAPTAVKDALSSLFKATIDGQNFLLLGSNLSTGTALRPLGLNGLLLDSGDAQKAWTPGEDATISEFGKVKAAEGIPEGAAYYAKLGDDSTVYFKAGENNTWVKIDSSS
ncbi:MAG: hypothetical protein RIT26_917 [Pseudomonadota bacterium]